MLNQIYLYISINGGKEIKPAGYTLRQMTIPHWLKYDSTETVGLLGMGTQDRHLDFYTAPER